MRRRPNNPITNTRATTLYAKTRDILLVKQQMGHKKIETTLIYTQLLTYQKTNGHAKPPLTSKKTKN